MSLLFKGSGSVIDFTGKAGATVTGPWPVVDAGVPLTSGPRAFEIYSTQPSVRKVVEFIARNVARVHIQAFEGEPYGKRRMLTEGPLYEMVNHPNPASGTSMYRLIHDIVADLMLFDRFLVRYEGAGGTLTRLSTAQWRFHRQPGTIDEVDGFTTTDPTSTPEGFIRFDDGGDHGYFWDKGYGGYEGVSPMLTLQQTLDEHTEAVKWRRQLWKHGLRMPGYWSQDLTEAALSPDARKRLQAELGNWIDGGGKEGESPILRGITYQKVGAEFTPKDAQEVEGRTLSDIEVASAYQVPPEMVGAREGKYATQQAFRDALYRETLGPLFEQLQGAFNEQICSRFFEGQFIEFNIESALRGSFIDDAQVTSSAVGGPWMSVNEARADHGLAPKGPDYDEILTQLNTVRGGGTQASPHDSGSQNLGGANA